MFRAKFVHALQQAVLAGRLPGDPACTVEGQRLRARALHRHDWVVYAKTPLAGPASVLDHLARYTRRTAIGNQRLVALEGDKVLVRVRADDRGGQRTIGLPGTEFVARLLQHVLPAGFKRIRHDGLLAPAATPPTACRGPLKLTLPTTTAIPAVQFNKIYLTPCRTLSSSCVASASDKRCSLGLIPTKMNHSYALFVVAIAVTLIGLPPSPVYAQVAQPNPKYRLKVNVTGSAIRDTIASSHRYPLNRAYSRFTDEEKASLRSEYEDMPATDEPPFPESGLEPILDALSLAIERLKLEGDVTIFVTIDATGQPREFSLVRYPDLETAKTVAYILAKTRFKPAMCSGEPCTMQWAFRTTLLPR